MATLNFPDDPTTGDVYKDGNSGFSYEWNGTVWISTDPSTASNIREIDDISSGFDGSDTTFTLQVAGVNIEPVNAQQLIVSVGGVMQNAGQDFTVSGSTLTFTTAPSASLTFFGVYLGTALSLNTIADGSVGSAALKTEDFTIGGSGNTVTIPGNLTVQGTETIINTERLDIQDKTVGIASTNAPSSTSQDDAGIVIYGQTQITALYDVDKAALGISTAVSVSGFVTAAGLSVLSDSDKIFLGAEKEMQVFHDGTDSLVKDTRNSGTVKVQADNFTVIDKDAGQTMLTAAVDGAVTLRYNGTTRFETASDDKGGGVRVTGKIVGTAATIGTGVTINNTGIDAGNAGIVTAGTVAAPSALTLKTGGTTEAVEIDSSQRVNIGGAAVSQTRTVNIGSNAEANLAIETHNDATSEAANIRFYKSGNTGASPQVVETDDNIAQLIAYGYDGTDYASAAASVKMSVDGAPGSNDMPGKIILSTTADGATSPTERLKITSSGGFQFSNGLFDEKCKIVAGQLSDNDNINLIDGMVYYFSTAEDTTASPNIRIDASNTLQDAMDIGDVCTVTVIINAAAAGYYANVRIDGNNVTEEWVGGAAPSAGSADGLDIYTYTIIKIADATGDSGFKVIANMTNATN